MGRGKKKRGTGGRYDYALIMARIEIRRKTRGVSADGIAEELGIGDQTHYHKKRRGDASSFNFEEIGLIAEQLDAPPGWPFIDETATQILEQRIGAAPPLEEKTENPPEASEAASPRKRKAGGRV